MNGSPQEIHDSPVTGRFTGSFQLLGNRPLRLLFGARTVSLLGDFLVPVALVTAMLQNGGSPTDLGLVLAARSLPSVALLLFGGMAGDRFPRRRVMVLADSAACVAQVTLGVLLIGGETSVAVVAALVATRATTAAFFNPAATGAIAELSPPGLLQRAYGLFGTVATGAEILGPAIAGGLLLWLSPGWVLVVDGLTFAWSAWLVWQLPDMRRSTEPGSRRPFVSELFGGLTYIRTQRWLLLVIASACAFQFVFITSLDVLGPATIADMTGSAKAWSVLLVAFGIGATIGSLLGMHVRLRRPLLAGYIVVSCCAGPPLAALALHSPIWVLVVSQIAVGAAVGFFNVIEQYVIAERVPIELMARVDAVNRLGSTGLRPLGMALIGPVALTLGMTQTLLFAATASVLAIALPLAFRDIRRLRRA